MTKAHSKYNQEEKGSVDAGTWRNAVWLSFKMFRMKNCDSFSAVIRHFRVILHLREALFRHQCCSNSCVIVGATVFSRYMVRRVYPCQRHYQVATLAVDRLSDTNRTVCPHARREQRNPSDIPVRYHYIDLVSACSSLAPFCDDMSSTSHAQGQHLETAFSVAGPHELNNLPVDIRNITDLSTFKRAIEIPFFDLHMRIKQSLLNVSLLLRCKVHLVNFWPDAPEKGQPWRNCFRHFDHRTHWEGVNRFDTTTFELLRARISSRDASWIAALLYRPGDLCQLHRSLRNLPTKRKG